MRASLLAFSLAAAVAGGQQAGTLTAKRHPSLTWQKCTRGGCPTLNTTMVLDANWRWTHATSGSTKCYTGNKWQATLCPDGKSCAANCALDGADYTGTYGITGSGWSLTLQFVTDNVGARAYLMADDTQYQMLELLNQELWFDVDMSNIPCGLNGALYLSAMDADGGMRKYPTNKAGAKYATGYCDAQCPRDLKYINGIANVEGWTPSTNDANGIGDHGSCCSEMDIWEANKVSTAFTPHPCTTIEQHMCEGDSCGGTYSDDRYGVLCDADGCDFNSYRMGNTTFYGEGKTVDTSSKFTVVTQFIKDSAGDLAEIKAFYVQNGKVIENSQSNVDGVSGNSITQSFCKSQKTAFGDIDDFNKKGGLKQMGKALAQAMVLVMSIWDDHAANMLWLDSTYPVPKVPGAYRGSGPTTSGVPAEVDANAPNSKVAFSNIKFGHLGISPFSGGSSGTPPSNPSSSASPTSSTAKPSSTSTASNPSGTGAAHWAQCGGIGFSGPTTCPEPYTCAKDHDIYSQCV
uniref:Exoglucanase 1 n=1 Tax=Neurospora crassa (strain ATCC 24698 / 74-OR23-1A / CBS 708.71 / DSM 1257 / FGSC 987) TaxID=367110 RepID=GUX1B_NEUCR|nr:RecName: Full=Exoglucanase 1; AltName: Full=1,4-beta-cellobiohydrolase 1; AltName: Full=Exocellobiohydrolase 1; Flags: Precursor [Neurospora crassa OR74A]CAA54815.1 cellulose 1,4-beta-cellobiosidase [Neurospora crassa]